MRALGFMVEDLAKQQIWDRKWGTLEKKEDCF